MKYLPVIDILWTSNNINMVYSTILCKDRHKNDNVTATM